MKNKMRLVDANGLVKRILSLTLAATGLRTGKGVLLELLTKYREAILRVIEEQPTVDAVEVVRCKDCRYYEPPEDGDSLGVCKNGRLCVSNMGEVCPEENYYCPYSKRK